jgi:hypothetical protein
MKTIRRIVAALQCAALLCMFAVPAAAQSANAAIAGTVVDQRTALPVTGATITVSRDGTIVATTTSDGRGHYAIATVQPGVYTMTIAANGYDASQTTDLAIAAGSSTTANAALLLSAVSTRNNLTVIGRTSVSSNPLAAATTISQQISPENLTRTGQIRIGDQLATLPGVNFSTSSSVGDDSSINLRGFGSDESASLLDGHPVGPLGVGSGGFNFSLGPAFGLSQIDVTYGSGAQGLYGSDTIGGAVNYLTLSPTARPSFSFQQQVGGFGIRSSGITATGTTGKLGYAIAAGRLGEYGDFAPAQIAQSARPNNVQSGSVNPPAACLGQPDPANPGSLLPDVSRCNLAINTYAVSQNTEQTIGLVKFDYALSSASHLQATVYDALQWSDSTGNGDNDFLPFSTRLNQVNNGTPNCTTAGGQPGFTVSTDPVAGTTSCLTAQQFAAATSGPDGGGAQRQRSTRMTDYHLRFTTTAGPNNITADAFVNAYRFWKDSSLAGGVDASGDLLGTPTFADFYDTTGFLVSDELAGARNDFTFGFTLWHQNQRGIEDDISGLSPHIPTGYFGEWSYFARDNFMFDDRTSLFVNAWMKHSSVTERTTFDPRATLQFRPSRNDVVQFTYGRSDGAPSPQLKLAGAAVAADPGASLTSVSCNGFNDVTSAGNPNLQSEAANDFEVGYGHRFSRDSNIQLNGYVTTVANQLFGASQPLLAFGAQNVAFAPGALQTYVARLNSQCGLALNNQTVLQFLSVGTTFNAAHALARGIELTGRARLNRIAYVDYGYDIESSTKTGISSQILTSNPTVVNGAQLAGIPLHQANVSFDVAPGPWEFRIDNYYTEFNNGFNRPSYWHSNAFITRSLQGGRVLISLGGTNIFNNAVQYFGLLGLGTAAITNPVSGNSPAPSEEFGLAPAQLTLTVRVKN